jgi:hypothetical protein
MPQQLSVPTKVAATDVAFLNSASLLYWRRAIARTRATTPVRGKMVIIGDSTSMGAGAGSSGTSLLTGAYLKAWPHRLASMSSAPVQLSSNSWWGTQGYDGAAGITLSGYDPA